MHLELRGGWGQIRTLPGHELRRFEEENQVDRRELVFVQDDRQPLTLAFSPDSRRLALAGPANLFRVWEMTSGRECPFSPLKSLTGLTGVAFSPDSRRLAATGYDGRVKLWDADAGHERHRVRVGRRAAPVMRP